MTPRGQDAAALALHRFGFGPVGDSIAAIANDPRGALIADLDRPGAGQIAAILPSAADSARQVFDFRAQQQAEQKLALRAKREADASNASMSGSMSGAAGMSDAANTAPVAAAPPPKPANQPPPLP